MESMKPIVSVRNIKKYYPVNKGLLNHKAIGTVKAVNDVSLDIYEGETLGLIGESGCGKSTLARIIMGIVKATGGEVYFENGLVDKTSISGFRRKAQMIFQDPYSSLDPRMNIRRIVEEPLRIHTRLNGRQKLEILLPLLKKVGISEDALKKYPHEFSGGQRQRIGIARALAAGPKFLVCDEPVSALDMSIQAQILNLFKELKREYGLTYLFISHDMSVVKFVSDRIAVMYLGKIVELAPKAELFNNPLHPYAVGLMNSIPVPNPLAGPRKIVLEGDPPNPLNPPAGCPFRGRCPEASEICRLRPPALKEIKRGHLVSCHLFDACKGNL